MSNDPIVNALNNDPQYITALEDFFSKHSQTLAPFVDFEAGLSTKANPDKESPEA